MAGGSQQHKLTPGSDTPLFHLDADQRWRLASDGLQWTIQKRGGMQHEGRYAGELRWKNVRFLTTPEVLRRGMRELGIEPTAETLRRIGEFPPYVALWMWDGRSLDADDAGVEREPHPEAPETIDRNADHVKCVIPAAKASDDERASELAARNLGGI